MAETQVQRARGTSIQHASYTGPAGELTVNIDDYSLVLQDGSTAGGHSRLTPGILPPQGRLTLTTNVPVMTADVTAATTIFYTPYVGQWCPIFNGSVWLQVLFAQTSLALDSTITDTGFQASGSLYDIFAFLNAGVFTIGTGPAWASTSSRGSSSITRSVGGIWTNSATTTLRFGSATGNTVSVPANQATYLGTMFATANGQTGMQFAPAAAAGGSANVLGLFNAFNRIRTVSRCQDSTGSWTYNSATWRPADNSNNNRIIYVDGLAGIFPLARYGVFYSSSGGTDDGRIGLLFNAASGAPIAQGGAKTTGFNALAAELANSPVTGLNFVQAMESANAGTPTFFGAPFEMLSLTVDM